MCWNSAGRRSFVVLVGIQQPALSGICFGRGAGTCMLLAHILQVCLSGPSLKFLRLMGLMTGGEGKNCNFLPILALEYLCLPVGSECHNYCTPLCGLGQCSPFQGLPLSLTCWLMLDSTHTTCPVKPSHAALSLLVIDKSKRLISISYEMKLNYLHNCVSN